MFWLDKKMKKIDGVSDGDRTHDPQNHNLMLYQLSYTHQMVGAKRFELSTLWSQTRYANQTAPRPESKTNGEYSQKSVNSQ